MHIRIPKYLLSGKLSRFGVLLCSSAFKSGIDAFFKFDIYCYGIMEASSKNHNYKCIARIKDDRGLID